MTDSTLRAGSVPTSWRRSLRPKHLGRARTVLCASFSRWRRCWWGSGGRARGSRVATAAKSIAPEWRGTSSPACRRANSSPACRPRPRNSARKNGLPTWPPRTRRASPNSRRGKARGLSRARFTALRTLTTMAVTGRQPPPLPTKKILWQSRPRSPLLLPPALLFSNGETTATTLATTLAAAGTAAATTSSGWRRSSTRSCTGKPRRWGK
mmetsp:Transcript_11172/g.20731  ORF Transcript_11172/g.20731 Transcript_11172/m.20731 type:complete len:210 (-) Transcript_11172:35-664(-)